MTTQKEQFNPADVSEWAKRSGMGRRIKQRQMPEEFITPKMTFFESLARARIDERQVNIAVKYYHHLMEFGLDDEVEQLIVGKLVGSGAIGGRNLDLAAQSYVGVFFDKDMSREQQKLVAEMQKRGNQEAQERNEREKNYTM